ncbi:MAG: hypothetical protein HC771_24735, partial [Synechococcales cyanobacterium CRU_2_2]|nr:hypothetical protein [Synechococcales cyanobacterium CRU_2_2]
LATPARRPSEWLFPDWGDRSIAPVLYVAEFQQKPDEQKPDEQKPSPTRGDGL